MMPKVTRGWWMVPVAIAMAAVAPAQGLGSARVTGAVVDDVGVPMPGVTVTMTVAGSGESAGVTVTGGGGEFEIAGMKPGSYTLRAVLDGFQPVDSELKLVSDGRVDLGISLVPVSFGGTLEITAEAAPSGEVEVLDRRRTAAIVSDAISSEEMGKNSDSDAAGAVQRLTGITVVGDKYVYVRGLGERYSGATINGSRLPTTETEKRVVPLDLFPAELLESIDITKTSTPDMAGDLGSGTVEMETVSFPTSTVFSLSLGAGANSTATGNSIRAYAGGLGLLGDGGQPIPGIIPGEQLSRRTALDPTGFTPEEMQTFGQAFVGDWTGAEDASADPNTDFSLTLGDTFGPFGIVVSATSNHGYESIDEEQAFFGLDSGGQLVPRNDYDMVTDREAVRNGLVGNLALRLGDGHNLRLNSVFTRDTSNENRFQEGLNTNSGGLIRDYRVRYMQEEVTAIRLSGEHNLPGPGLASLLEWNGAVSEATNSSDLRENLYRESAGGVFALEVGSPESGKIEFFDLEDRIEEAGLDYTIFLSIGDGYGSVKGGLSLFERTRDFDARRFRFVTANQLQFDLTRTPEEIFIPENIRPGGFEIRETTGVNDAYDASHTIDAAYLMADMTFGKWRVIVGARNEDSDQRVLTFNPFDTEDEVESRNQSQDVLPSLNVIRQLGAATNLRFGYGRSLNRPEFRELSPFNFVEVTGGRSVAGNPDLTQATIDAFDLRWETFPEAGAVMAASVFYKRLDSPIERIVQPTTELRTSFVNADSATLWGLELEFRRSLEVLSSGLRNWSVNFNYAYVSSDVEVGEQDFSVSTSSNRPLEGQSDNVGNLAIQYLKPEWGTMVRLLTTHVGERITDVGSFGLPDIFESSYSYVDLVVSQNLDRLARGLSVKLAAGNLLDEERTFTQGSEIQRLYQPGRTLSLSVSYSLF